MHDLVHDLAISVVGGKFSTSHSGMTRIDDKTQHVSFHAKGNYMRQNFSSVLKAKEIRTVLSLYERFETGIEAKIDEQIVEAKIDDKFDAIFCNLRYLKVLNLSRMKISTLSNSIYKLKHLRYLNRSYNDIKKLPNSVADLLNLQVLELERCESLMRLPDNITKLVNLTDLNNNGCRSLSHMPVSIGKMTKLEKLPLFAIAKDHSISKHSGGLDELHSLNNLRGDLEIKNLSYVKNATSGFRAAQLNEKKHLQSLILDWYEDNAHEVANEEMGMEALCPQPNLKALEVCYYQGVKPPSWLPPITNLVSVSFEFCRSIQWLPPFDQLPNLKKLKLVGLTKLECIDVVNGGGSDAPLFFPSLTNLTLRCSPNLKGFERLSTDELPCFPCLSQLEIRGCPDLTYLSLFPELKTLVSSRDGMKSLMKILKTPTNSASSSFSTLSQLQDLTIRCMEDSLEDELLQHLPSLQHLKFYFCSMRSVCRYEKEDGMHWQSLNVLRSVEFQLMKNLVALPKGLQYVTSLQRLYINNCPSLACIPEWMPKLIALQHLTINRSPQLEERCKNNSCEDWPYISHIPNIEIGRKPIQINGSYLL